MKKSVLTILSVAALNLFAGSTQAQFVSDFEDLILPENSYFKGAVLSNDTSFTSGPAQYQHGKSATYHTWSSGWAYSNVLDTTELTYKNLYGAVTGKAFEGNNYAIGQEDSRIQLTGNAKGKVVMGLYITNTAYAHAVIKEGNQFSKKFGGPSGNDPDYFKLKIGAYYKGALKAESVDAYLADFRDEDNSKDYVLKTWKFVDLTTLGNTDSLVFSLITTDSTGGYPNTPSFFAIDKLTILDQVTATTQSNLNTIEMYPNPASDRIFVNSAEGTEVSSIAIADLNGNTILSVNGWNQKTGIDISSLNSGVYLLQLSSGSTSITKKIVKR